MKTQAFSPVWGPARVPQCNATEAHPRTLRVWRRISLRRAASLCGASIPARCGPGTANKPISSLYTPTDRTCFSPAQIATVLDLVFDDRSSRSSPLFRWRLRRTSAVSILRSRLPLSICALRHSRQRFCPPFTSRIHDRSSPPIDELAQRIPLHAVPLRQEHPSPASLFHSRNTTHGQGVQHLPGKRHSSSRVDNSRPRHLLPRAHRRCPIRQL